MLRVNGTAKIFYSVELDVDDISDDTMSMYDSDLLIAKALDVKLPQGCFVQDDIVVIESFKIEDDSCNNEPKQPLFVGVSKETDEQVSGFGWITSDYTDEYMKEKGWTSQDAYLYTNNGVVLCYLDSVNQVF